MNESIRAIDRVEYRKVKADGTLDMSPEGLILETNNNPSLIQRIKMWLGWYKCAGDAMMNWGLTTLTESIYDTYTHISFGTSDSTPADYTLNDVVSPIMTRVLAAKSYTTTYITDDTVMMVGILTPDAVYHIVETGIHTAVTGGHMGARQTNCDITTVIGNPIGVIWYITMARG